MWPGVLAGSLAAACGVGLLAVGAWLLARAWQRPPVLSLCVAIGAVQAFSLGGGVLWYFQRLVAHRRSLALLGSLRLGLFDTLEPLVPGALGPNGRGEVLSGFVSDAELVAEGLARTVSTVVQVTAALLAATVAVVLVSPPMAAVLLPGGALLGGAVVLAASLGRRWQDEAAAQRAVLAGQVDELVRSAPELVAFGRGDLVEARLCALQALSGRTDRWRAALAGGLGAAATLGAALVAAATLAVGAHAGPAGHAGLPGLAMAAFATVAGLAPCALLPSALARVAEARAAACRLLDLRDVVPAVPAQGHRVEVGGAPGGAPAAELRCAHVGPPGVAGPQGRGAQGHAGTPAGYAKPVDTGAGGLGPTSGAGGAGGVPCILCGVSLALAPGSRTALTGPNGAGKTTVVLSLLHFVGCHRGGAYLEGSDVSELDRAGIARLAAWAPEHTHVFAADLAANLRLGCQQAADGELWGALEAVGLESWARGLPDGLATRLGAGGRPVSSGEAQRLGAARALVSRAPVLLLDEPTAHLDPRSAARMLHGLAGAAGDRTVLVVSHDDTAVEWAQQVVVLDRGRVVEPVPG